MTQRIPRSTSTWFGSAALGLTLAACGMSNGSNSTPGQAFTDAPIEGSIVLYDASLPMQARAASMPANGLFVIQTTGLSPPYLLRAEWAEQGKTRQLYAVSEGDDNLDINGFTDAAYWGACQGQPENQFFRESDAAGKRAAADRSRALLASMLKSPMAPLFQRYAITDHRTDRVAVRRLLADVIVSRVEGVMSVTNRATSLVIFVGQIGSLDQGAFTAGNMPPGPTAPAPACASFTYSAFGACQPNSTQVRSVLTSSPAGCSGGSPLTTQACTYVPPVSACTSFTYSAYGACQPNSTQVRTVLTSSPAGCSGGSPLTTRACTYVPPVSTCTGFTYSAYGACQPNSTQVRSVLTSSPAGCTGGTPLTTQACTYVPPVSTCTSFTYSAYGACMPNSTRVRSVLTSRPAGCTGGSPITTQACTYVPPVTTCTDFTYSPFLDCMPNSTQVRSVLTSGPAGCTGGDPLTTQACTYVPPVTTCTDFTYSPFLDCMPNSTQVRTVLTSGPAGCTGGDPLTTQACTYVAP